MPELTPVIDQGSGVLYLPQSYIRAAAPAGRLGRSGVASIPSTGGVGSAVLSTEDYNPDLQGVKLYDELDRMRKSDSQVRAGLQAITLPLRAADWHVKPASDSPRDREIAEWLEAKLIEVAPPQDPRMPRSRSWHDTLRQILLHLPLGVMPFETIWEMQDDAMLRRPMAVLADLSPRMPRTVQEWKLDDNDRLAGIKQGFTRAGEWLEPEIPAEKLVVFVNEMEGADYRGVSILRAARKDWTLKERAQRVNAIALERRAAGVDVGTLTVDDDNKRTQGEQVLMTVRTHERGYVQETPGWTYRIQGIEGATLDPLPTIQYCDLLILRGLLAEFIAMGGNSSGSLAMHQDKTSFFVMGLKAIAKQVTDPIDQELLPRWVSYNWPNVTEYPRLEHSRLDSRDAKMVADALAQLMPQGAITVDDDVERELRELLDLPELPEERERIERRPAPNPPPGTGDPDNPNNPRMAQRRPRTKAERLVDFAAMSRGMDQAQERIVKSYLPVQRRQIERLVDEAAKAVQSGSPDRLQNIGVPFRAEAAREFAAPLIDLYRQGQQEVQKELAKMGTQHLRLASPLDPTEEGTVLRWLQVRALTVATALAERLRTSMMRVALDMLRRGDTDRNIIAVRLEALSDREITREAGAAVSEALNLGRDSVAGRNQDVIAATEYSAIMDSGTCSQCQQQDGRHFQYGSDDYWRNKPPYRECSGFGNPRCRCVYIYTLKDEGEQV